MDTLKQQILNFDEHREMEIESLMNWMNNESTIRIVKEWLLELNTTIDEKKLLSVIFMYIERETLFDSNRPEDNIMSRETTIFYKKFMENDVTVDDLQRVMRFRKAWSLQDRRAHGTVISFFTTHADS